MNHFFYEFSSKKKAISPSNLSRPPPTMAPLPAPSTPASRPLYPRFRTLYPRFRTLYPRTPAPPVHPLKFAHKPRRSTQNLTQKYIYYACMIISWPCAGLPQDGHSNFQNCCTTKRDIVQYR